MRQRTPTINKVGEKIVLYTYNAKKMPNRVLEVVRLTQTIAICKPIASLWSASKEERIKRWDEKPAADQEVADALKYFSEQKAARKKADDEQKKREANPHWQAAHRCANQVEWGILSYEQLSQIVRWLDAAIEKGIADGKDS